MRCALIADVHANRYALTAVLADIAAQGVDAVVNGGDTFGYYPWAEDVFELLAPHDAAAVLGNHDAMVISGIAPAERPFYWDAVEHNRATLSNRARNWLVSLPTRLKLDLDGTRTIIVHGTPTDPLQGRYYPDDTTAPNWLPGLDEVLILAQTHYPLIRRTKTGGLLLNPGAVGQPRDGDPRASWILFDTRCGDATLRRVPYELRAAQTELRAMAWSERAIAALDKRRSGERDRWR